MVELELPRLHWGDPRAPRRVLMVHGLGSSAHTCWQVAEALGLKLGQVAQPLRAALTGRRTSPGIFDVLWAMGREGTLARLKRGLTFIG